MGSMAEGHGRADLKFRAIVQSPDRREPGTAHRKPWHGHLISHEKSAAKPLNPGPLETSNPQPKTSKIQSPKAPVKPYTKPYRRPDPKMPSSRVRSSPRRPHAAPHKPQQGLSLRFFPSVPSQQTKQHTHTHTGTRGHKLQRDRKR